jgi:hypothetical protein
MPLILLRLHVFTATGMCLLSRCPGDRWGYTHTHTDWWEEFMKLAQALWYVYQDCFRHWNIDRRAETNGKAILQAQFYSFQRRKAKLKKGTKAWEWGARNVLASTVVGFICDCWPVGLSILVAFHTDSLARWQVYRAPTLQGLHNLRQALRWSYCIYVPNITRHLAIHFI